MEELKAWAERVVGKIRQQQGGLGRGIEDPRAHMTGLEFVRLACMSLGIDPYTMPLQRIVIDADVCGLPKVTLTLSPRVEAMSTIASDLSKVECDVEVIHAEEEQ